MKKIFFIVIGCLFLGIVPHVLAASNFVPLAGIPGLTQNVPATPAGLAGFFNNLYKYLIGLAAALAVIEIIWGGLEVATNKDNVSKLIDAKGRIMQAILGLILVLSPVLVFSIINPSILNLSLNLPPLNTATTPNQATSTPLTTSQIAQSTPPPATGCQILKNGTYLQTATCASSNEASNYCNTGAGFVTVTTTCQDVMQTGMYTDTCAVAYCEKTMEVVYMSNIVIPRDLPKQNEFSAGCAADGGAMNATRKTLSYIGPNTGPGNCPLDSGFASGIAGNCYTETLTCKPK